MTRTAPVQPAPAQPFLLLHGHEHHKPPGHWLAWLSDQLASAGATVRYPQLPDADDPSLERWLRRLDLELNTVTNPPVVICHSLSALLWLHALPDIATPIDRVLLVAPPSPDVVAAIPEITEFAITEFTVALVTAAARYPTLVLTSDNDPYCPEGAQQRYGTPLHLSVEVIPEAGHLDLAAGYGRWPSLLAWCHDASQRITGRADAPA